MQPPPQTGHNNNNSNENMAGWHMSQQMLEFCNENPALANVAIVRDAAARANFQGYDYALYDQGSLKAISDRANAPAPGVAAIGTPAGNGKSFCSICNKNVNDFRRHNQEKHIRDPTWIFYCPYLDCTTSIARDGQVTRDDHLAGTHNDFRNMDGRGGELLLRSDQQSVLKKLTVPAARYVAEYRHNVAQDYVFHRDRLVQRLNEANLWQPDLAAATLPAELQVGKDFGILTKTEAIAHAITAGHTLTAWDTLFATGQGMLR